MYKNLQTEISECGLACISLALSEFGSSVDMVSLRRKFPIGFRGTNIKELVDIASALDISSRVVRCELNELSELKLPAILHWNLNHFVLLTKITRRGAVIIDPAIGKKNIPFDVVGKSFTGIAIELTKKHNFKKRKEKSPLSLKSWIKFDSQLVSKVLILLGFSLFLQLYLILSPLYIQLSLDQAVVKSDRDLLFVFFVGFFVFSIFNFFAVVIRGLFLSKINGILNWNMTVMLFGHLIRLPLPWFKKRRFSDVLLRFESIVPIRNLISAGLITTIVDGVLAFATGLLMFLYSVNLSLIVFAGVLCYFLFRSVILPFSMRAGMEALSAKILESEKRIETIRAIQTIKIMGAENQRETEWANFFSDMIKKDIKHSNLEMLSGSFKVLIDSFVLILTIYFGALFVLESNMTIGVLYAFLSYSSQFSARMVSLFDQIINWRLLDIYSYRLADVVMSGREVQIYNNSFDFKDFNGRVELNNLYFKYSQSDDYLLANISISIKAGEFVVITGPSGCGKSTLLKIICGLYPMSSGEILIDGHSMGSVEAKALRNKLGVVMQDDELLTGTVAENVAFFSDEIDLDKVWRSLRLACVDEDVMNMPMKADTFLGDMGSMLSGGQKQRLLLARALYREPKILILDEATSHLDLVREDFVNKALQSLSITRIVVAHRKETIASADRIIYINDGRVLVDKKNTDFELCE